MEPNYGMDPCDPRINIATRLENKFGVAGAVGAPAHKHDHLTGILRRKESTFAPTANGSSYVPRRKSLAMAMRATAMQGGDHN